MSFAFDFSPQSSIIPDVDGDVGTAIHNDILLDAIAIAEDALVQFRVAEDAEKVRAARNTVAKVYLLNKEVDEASRVASEILPECQRLGDKKQEANALNTIARVHNLTGQAAQALEKATEALSLFTELNDRPGMAMALQTLSQVYAAKGDRAEAQRTVDQAVDLFVEDGDMAGEASATMMFLDLHSAFGELSQAVSTAREVAGIYRCAGDRIEEARALQTAVNYFLAQIQQDAAEGKKPSKWETDAAMKSIDAAIEIFKERKETLKRANAMLTLAALQSALGDSKTALDTASDSIKLAMKMGNKTAIASAMLTMADVQSKTNWDQARETARNAVNIFKGEGDEVSAAAAEDAVEWYRSRGNPRKKVSAMAVPEKKKEKKKPGAAVADWKANSADTLIYADEGIRRGVDKKQLATIQALFEDFVARQSGGGGARGGAGSAASGPSTLGAISEGVARAAVPKEDKMYDVPWLKL